MQDNTDDLPPRSSRSGGSKTATKYLLNGVIVVLLLVAGYFAYGLIVRNGVSQIATEKQSNVPAKIVQLDVLNGCGVKSAAARFTNFLRSNGFDVVEMKNYKTFNVPHTFVIDRVGDMATARRVAGALGVQEKNIIQQINPDYFVHVSVIIGADYGALRVPE